MSVARLRLMGPAPGEARAQPIDNEILLFCALLSGRVSGNGHVSSFTWHRARPADRDARRFSLLLRVPPRSVHSAGVAEKAARNVATDPVYRCVVQAGASKKFEAVGSR